MLAAIRPMGLPIKGYAALLGALSVAGFVAGGWINYDYARSNPGADPYTRRPQIIVPIAPAAPVEPVPQQKVKVLPPPEEASEQAPLVSSIDPRSDPTTTGKVIETPGLTVIGGMLSGPSRGAAPATANSSDRATMRATTGVVGCTNVRASSNRVTADSDCRASGTVDQGSIGDMTIGAGSVTVVPTQ